MRWGAISPSFPLPQKNSCTSPPQVYNKAIKNRLFAIEKDANGKAVLAVGKSRYHVVVVSNMLTIRPSTVSILKEFIKQGGKVILAGDYPMYFFYRHSAIIDVHTDKLMYESLIQNRDYYNPIQAAMSINQYPRYWHGYQVLLRPLTVVFQVQELRYLGMLTFHLLFFWSAWLMAKKTKPLYAMFYILTVASGYVVFLPVCFQFLTTFLVLFVSLIVLLSRYDKNKPLPAAKWMLYFFVVGMVENFFDFLTYPILTLGIPLVVLLWLRVRDEQADFRSNFWFMFKASLSWFFGYALTWISKWLLSAAILGVRYFWRTMSVVQYRLEGSEEEPLDRIGTIQRNLKAWLNVQDGGVISWSKIALLILIVAVVLIIFCSACLAIAFPTGCAAATMAFSIGNHNPMKTLKFCIPYLIIGMASTIASAMFFYPVYG